MGAIPLKRRTTLPTDAVTPRFQRSARGWPSVRDPDVAELSRSDVPSPPGRLCELVRVGSETLAISRLTIWGHTMTDWAAVTRARIDLVAGERESESFDAWFATVPDRVERCQARWGLVLGRAYVGGAAGYVVQATTQYGLEVVLKLAYPHRESEGEASALVEWDGDGAIRLLDSDGELSALLLERCEPGTPLSEEPAEVALEVIAGLLPRLWVEPQQPFRCLSDEAQWWIDDLKTHTDDYRRHDAGSLVDVAIDALQSLAPIQGTQVLVHQDLHGENILAARREPWLVIDPKPLLGEREFALAPVIRAFEFEHTRRAVMYRRDFLCDALGVDRSRATGWAMAQTVAWALDSDYTAQHLDTAGWLADAW